MKQHNSTHHNSTQHNHTQHKSTQHNNTQHKSTEHNNIQRKNTCCIILPAECHYAERNIFIDVLSVIMLTVVKLNVVAPNNATQFVNKIRLTQFFSV